MRMVIALLVGIVMAGAIANAQDEDPFRKLDEQWESMEKDLDKSHEDYLARQDAIYRAYVDRIEKKWNDFEESSAKIWVDYTDDSDAKSRVDYDNGATTIDVLARADDPDADATARATARSALMKLFVPKPASGQAPLGDQVAFDPGGTRTVTSGNAGSFFDQQLGNQVQRVGTFTSQDGVRRIRYRINVPMVKNHVVRRAEKFMPAVVRNAERFNIDPKLVLAVIYSESAFNPLAKSWADAYGLMQLIPRYGARDAYRLVYKSDKLVSPEYLYDPEKNIELGVAYLHILFYKEWNSEPDFAKQEALSICSYNWGPHNVRKKVYKRFNGPALDFDQLYARLKNHTPEETQHYLDRVLSRKSYFDPFFD